MTDLENKKHEMTDAERETIEKIGWSYSRRHDLYEGRLLKLFLEDVLSTDFIILVELCNQILRGFLKVFVSKSLSEQLFLFTSLFLEHDYIKNKRNVIRFLVLAEKFIEHTDSCEGFDGEYARIFIKEAFKK